MRVIIVDDELLARAVLREHLAGQPDVDIVGECANGFEAVKAIAELAPDLVFLDIQMPRLDGFEVVELAGAKTAYVFVTAYDQFALRAFEVHALDYLLKPFSRERLEQALAHARERLGNPASKPGRGAGRP
jgi:two-component system LytT family response regulator